jgi:hypothetical protein
MPRQNWFEIQEKLNAENPGRAERMAAAEAGALAEYEVFEKNLPALRKARDLTQQEVARRLEIGQGQVSRLEKQSDMYLSTLAGYVAALGGELKLVAVFEGREIPLSIPALAGAETEAAVEEPRRGAVAA